MRVNFAKKLSGLQNLFCKQYIKEFAVYYNVSNQDASNYVMEGKQGIESFTEFLKIRGYYATPYFLPPNDYTFGYAPLRDIALRDTSPSYGFIINDSDPEIVKFKLANS